MHVCRHIIMTVGRYIMSDKPFHLSFSQAQESSPYETERDRERERERERERKREREREQYSEEGTRTTYTSHWMYSCLDLSTSLKNSSTPNPSKEDTPTV